MGENSRSSVLTYNRKCFQIEGLRGASFFYLDVYGCGVWVNGLFWRQAAGGIQHAHRYTT